MVPVSPLSRRQRDVLAALVCEFIASGLPAGSRTLSRHYGLGISSASVRTTMSDLEEMGLVFQPHTSAGRLPTDLGIRVFVDVLMAVRRLSGSERETIEHAFEDVKSPGDLWHRTVHLLSDLTQHAAVVRSPRADSLVLRQLSFVPLSGGDVLAVLVGQGGITQSRILHVRVDLSPSRLERIHNYLNELVPGRTLIEARHVLAQEASESRRTVDRFMTEALELGRCALDATADEPEIVVHGQARLVHSPAFANIDRLRQLVELLDDQERLVGLLDATLTASGPIVLIGAEHPLTELASCSMISARYDHGPSARGSICVIGPRSMDYARVLPLVEYMAEYLSSSVIPPRDEGRGDRATG
jgi:heat-inducible transcriptional repressor